MPHACRRTLHLRKQPNDSYRRWAIALPGHRTAHRTAGVYKHGRTARPLALRYSTHRTARPHFTVPGDWAPDTPPSPRKSPGCIGVWPAMYVAFCDTGVHWGGARHCNAGRGLGGNAGLRVRHFPSVVFRESKCLPTSVPTSHVRGYTCDRRRYFGNRRVVACR